MKNGRLRECGPPLHHRRQQRFMGTATETAIMWPLLLVVGWSRRHYDGDLGKFQCESKISAHYDAVGKLLLRCSYYAWLKCLPTRRHHCGSGRLWFLFPFEALLVPDIQCTSNLPLPLRLLLLLLLLYIAFFPKLWSFNALFQSNVTEFCCYGK